MKKKIRAELDRQVEQQKKRKIDEKQEVESYIKLQE